jgi:hypothetical protein
MKTLLLVAGVAAFTLFAPADSKAQGVEVGVPGVGVRIGDPGYRHYRSYDYDRPRWRDREVRYGRSCRTVTIERDDGSVKRIRRCD